LKRRDFLLTSGTSILSLTIPKISLATVNKNYFKLTAQLSKFQFSKKSNEESNLWLYNQQSPGPTISVEKGEELTVEFTNLLKEPTTIHWHGIRNINAMDGVANLTQPPIEPGETFIYKFPVNDAGTFWYHAHNKSWEQVSRGLYGALIVKDTLSIGFDRDITLVADDWRLNKDYQFDEKSLGSLMDWSHQGRLGNWLTINGKSNPKINIEENSNVRLRLINASNARVFNFKFNNYKPDIIALDGVPCSPFKKSSFQIAPAQRIDFLIKIKNKNLNLFENSTSKPYPTATFDIINSKKPFNKVVNLKNLETWNKFPNINKAQIIDIHMQGGAMGNLSSAIFNGEKKSLRELASKESKLWAFNGEIGSYSYSIADIEIGKIVILKIWNDTSWKHSMHLHGHHFWVKSIEFSKQPKMVTRDTYLMQPNEKVDLVFEANNPGLWLFHCHMLEHAASGMGGVISIS
jgi:FtsP/CotA-like multicopper oxidase with cupredoxin domain